MGGRGWYPRHIDPTEDVVGRGGGELSNVNNDSCVTNESSRNIFFFYLAKDKLGVKLPR